MRLIKYFVWSILPMFSGVVSPHISADVMAANADAQYQHVSSVSQKQALELVKIGLNKSIIIDLPQASKEVLISNPEIVDAVMRTSRRVYLMGMKAGATNIFFFDKKGKQILALELHVEQDITALRDLYRRIFPDTAINIDILNGNLILTGMVNNTSQAAQVVDIASQFAIASKGKVINMLSLLEKQQVFLKVIIAEVSRNITQKLGVNMKQWIGDVEVFKTPDLFRAAFTSAPALGGGGAAPDTSVQSNYSLWDDDYPLSGETAISAMEKNNFLRTLAEPTLTAISGEKASFLAGGEFPVPVSVDNGKIGIEFKPFGISLAFVPIVLSKGRISLKVQAEISELSSEVSVQIAENLQINGLKVRRTDTTVELPSGGSLVIAGLIKDDTKHEFNGIPGIKDTPILGPLFRSKYFQRNETELIVLVMPYLVKPTSRDKLSLPTDSLSRSTSGGKDEDIFRQINRIYGANGGHPSGLYQGKIGFIVQ